MTNTDIHSAIKAFDSVKNSLEIWVVANISDTVQNMEDFIHHANYSEFFTRAEFASIISAISSINGYVRIFYSETELITYVCSNNRVINFDNIILYNFARDGIREGKKSLIPAFCDLYSIKYTGSNPFVISLLRNKFIYSKYLEMMGITIPASMRYMNYEFINDNTFAFPKRYIIKNNTESASIGLSERNIIEANSIYDLYSKVKRISEEIKSSDIIVQEYISGNECEVFVIKHKNQYYAFSPIMLIIHNSEILTDSISDNYEYSFELLSNKYSQAICNNIQRITERAAKYLNISGHARFDYRIDLEGNAYLTDIAGTPYITRHSSIDYLFTSILNLEYSDIFKLISYIKLDN